MNARFLVPGTYVEGNEIELPDDEARHASRVLRLSAGAIVRVFDGRGHEFSGTITRTTKSTVAILIGRPENAATEARVAITLAHAVLKGDKMDDVVRDAVMIGAAAVLPIVTTRSEVTLSALGRGNRLERWTRVAVASAKQCGRAVVPQVLTPLTFDEALASLGALTLPQPALMLVEPSVVDEGVQSLNELDQTPPHAATVIVGPEGGWTPEDVARATAVCRLVRLGGRTLRADAMATVAITALFTRWGEF